MPIPSQPTTNISLGPTLGPSGRSISQEFSPSASNIPLGAYRRGDRVADHPINSPLPAPGQSISFSQFNGKSVVLRYTLNAQNINGFTHANSPQRTGTTRSQGFLDEGRYLADQPGLGVQFAIPAPSVVGSATRTQDAFTTGTNSPTTWNPTVAIRIVNQGHIVGAGGAGGAGGNANPANFAGFAGQSGGTALVAQRPIFVQNVGTVGGGGGGGGGGATAENYNFDDKVPVYVYDGGSGGGGGAGQTVGAGGAGLNLPDFPNYFDGGNGSSGTLQAGGAGGTQGADGGNGGGLGQTGTAGQSAPSNTNTWPPPQLPSDRTAQGGAGGAGGYYAKGDANITWQQQGTKSGQVQPTV